MVNARGAYWRCKIKQCRETECCKNQGAVAKARQDIPETPFSHQTTKQARLGLGPSGRILGVLGVHLPTYYVLVYRSPPRALNPKSHTPSVVRTDTTKQKAQQEQ